jgi:ABC-2 type transport system ATP-binding protein
MNGDPQAGASSGAAWSPPSLPAPAPVPSALPPVTGPRPMLELEHVSKWFGDVVAVSDVSFSVGSGVTALLGPNGAGKSTVLRLLVGLARPSQGRVRVLGRDPRRDLDLLGRIGIVPQQEGLFEPFTAHEFVTAAARLLRLPAPEEAAAAALAIVELDPADRRTVRTLSKGNRQRVKVAAALVHDPEVLVLDEPLNGLDPRQRVHLIDLVRRLGDRPDKAVVVSSHVLDEVERFGSRILVIAQGRLAAEGDFRAIRDLMDDRPHRLRLVTEQANALAAALLRRNLVTGVRIAGPDHVEVETTDIHGFRRAIAGAARELGAPLDEVVPLDDDLDSVFRYLVGR